MKKRGLKFDMAFTSNLERAWRTCAIILSASGQSDIDVVRSSRLNERHYGALQGFSKNCPDLASTFSEEKVVEWRRSYATAPPSLEDKDFVEALGHNRVLQNIANVDPRYQDDHMTHFYNKAHGLGSNNADSDYYPLTESLRQCEDRAHGYYKSVIAPKVRAGKRVLVVAHANTIRALVKGIDEIGDDMIAQLKIPNGIPLVYTLDEDLEPVSIHTSEDALGVQANYLVSARNHKAMMSYERCVRKKLRALFEYLDENNDGRITPLCLQNGLIRLQTYDDQHLDEGFTLRSSICEYEIEELLRCIPNTDDRGGITLDDFLESEKTILPRLERLRLLQ
jgi:2,3-bisphosphoglycerate-dependent phosphoglycerate mutase